MQILPFIVVLCSISALVNGAHVISNSALPCSPKSGQLVFLDWSHCQGNMYQNLSPVINSKANKDVDHKPGSTSAKICFKGQFVDAKIWLDNGNFGSEQEKVHVYTEQDEASLQIEAWEADNKGNVIKTYPTKIYIREASFYDEHVEIDGPLNSDNGKTIGQQLDRPPNYKIHVFYCK